MVLAVCPLQVVQCATMKLFSITDMYMHEWLQHNCFFFSLCFLKFIYIVWFIWLQLRSLK
jgi:hypothetical protein